MRLRLAEAREIRAVVRQHLAGAPAVVRQHLPPDFAPLLPRDLDEPVWDPLAKAIRLSPWWLDVSGTRATLTHVPPGGMSAHTRVWFSLELQRGEAGWQVVAPGVTFAHAHARRP